MQTHSERTQVGSRPISGRGFKPSEVSCTFSHVLCKKADKNSEITSDTQMKLKLLYWRTMYYQRRSTRRGDM